MEHWYRTLRHSWAISNGLGQPLYPMFSRVSFELDCIAISSVLPGAQLHLDGKRPLIRGEQRPKQLPPSTLTSLRLFFSRLPIGHFSPSCFSPSHPRVRSFCGCLPACIHEMYIPFLSPHPSLNPWHTSTGCFLALPALDPRKYQIEHGCL